MSVDSDSGSLIVDFLSSLARHVLLVNGLRVFSGGDDLLASGNGDSTVLIWRLQHLQSDVTPLEEDSVTGASDVSDVRDRDNWKPFGVLRGHL